jgi:hypothetical protein
MQGPSFMAINAKNVNVGELVTSGPTPFWKPPPLIEGPQPASAGKWSKKTTKAVWRRFVEVDANAYPGLRLMLKEGETTAMAVQSMTKCSEKDAAIQSDAEAPVQDSTQHTYWDQYHGRRLTFIQPFPHTKRVHYNHSIFGFPLHQRTYLMKEGHCGFSYMPKSNWAYLQAQ